MNEIWKSLDIINCSRYLVSNQGNVFDKEYNMNLPLKHRVDIGGYIRVPLIADDGTHFSMAVHRLVMIGFDYREDYKALEVDHINCIKDDNRLENLRWVTHTENMNNPNTLNKFRGRKQKRNESPELHEYRSKVAKLNYAKSIEKRKTAYSNFRNSERYSKYIVEQSQKLTEAKLKRWNQLIEIYDLNKTLADNREIIFQKTGHKYAMPTLARIRNYKDPNHIKHKKADYKFKQKKGM